MHAAISRRCYFSLATKTPRHSQPGGLAAKKAMRSFARGLTMLDQAGAKVVAFDFLFTEPDEPVPAELREAAGAAAEALAGERSRLEKLAESGRDNRFAAAIQASGHVLLPIGLSFVDPPGEEPAWLSQSAYARFEKSELSPVFPLRPKSAVLPIETLASLPLGSAMSRSLTIAMVHRATITLRCRSRRISCPHWRYARPPLISASLGRRSRSR